MSRLVSWSQFYKKCLCLKKIYIISVDISSDFPKQTNSNISVSLKNLETMVSFLVRWLKRCTVNTLLILCPLVPTHVALCYQMKPWEVVWLKLRLWMFGKSVLTELHKLNEIKTTCSETLKSIIYISMYGGAVLGGNNGQISLSGCVQILPPSLGLALTANCAVVMSLHLIC